MNYRPQLVVAIKYLRAVHGDPWVHDWWTDTGSHQSWTIAWHVVPLTDRFALADALADRQEYLQEALQNMDTPDVAIALMQCVRLLERIQAMIAATAPSRTTRGAAVKE